MSNPSSAAFPFRAALHQRVFECTSLAYANAKAAELQTQRYLTVA